MRNTLILFVILLASTALAASPNVLLIITDDQGYGDLACHGNPVIKTPHLDSLHARSIRLTNFHVSPTCAPTRAALMTGRYTNSTGTWHTIMGRSLLNAEELTLADCFRANGYRTGIFGKWHLGDNYPFRPQDRGFDEALVHGGGGVWQTPDYFGNDYFDDTYLRNGVPEKQKGFCTDVWFNNAMNFMRDTHLSGAPFFCYLSTNAPHSPMWAPDEYTEMYESVAGLSQPGFYGMITNIDDNVGRVVQFLEENSLTDDTILIFMTDNGTAAGHKVFNAGMRERKGSAYEGGHLVPFFITWPNQGLTGPRDIDTLTAHIDVLPTLVDLCGLEKPEGPEVHGRSLRPLLFGSNEEWPSRTIVTDSQRLYPLTKWRRAAVMTDRWRLVREGTGGIPAVRQTARPRKAPPALELYDILNDPGQAKDLSSFHPDLISWLRVDYEKWWELVSERADQYSRIILGNDAENPSRLTSHDWNSDGALKTWNQRGIRQAQAVNGAWALEIDQAGTYRFELRRWPKELDLPINAAFEDETYNREQTQGKAINAVRARLKVGDVEGETVVDNQMKAAVFEADLVPGPALLETWFIDADGTERGAYFVYVERL